MNDLAAGHRLSDEDFLFLICAAPLVAIDLVIRRADGAVLLGRRRNDPAKGYWFVPGGRVRKGEMLDEAFHRIAGDETGLAFDFRQARLLGAYTHYYDTNVFGKAGITTHYVTIAYQVNAADAVDIEADDQHSEMRWFNSEDALECNEVHLLARAYFYADGSYA